MEGATMSTDAAGRPDTWSRPEQLRFGREVIATEAQALSGLAERLSDEFCQAVHLLLECRGNVMVTGMGKAGLIGQKITATLASTGTTGSFRASGGGHSRRPGPHSSRRRGAGAVDEW